MNPKYKGFKKFFCGMTLLMILFSLPSGLTFGETLDFISKELETAILAEDWARVSSLLSYVDQSYPSAIYRLIKAHANIAVNNNNVALCIFFNASEDDLVKWDNWTKRFEQKYPGRAIVYYLRGDALARIERYDDALDKLEKALKLNPEHVLSLNARGIVFAAKGDVELARKDFDKAIEIMEKSNGKLADVYANRATWFIQKKEGAEGAIKRFDKAIRINPEFALALFGRGLMKLILNQNDEASNDLETALQNVGCENPQYYMAHNFWRYGAKAANVDLSELIEEFKDPGTTLSIEYKEYKKSEESASYWGALSNAFRNMKSLPFNQHFADFASNRSIEKLEQIYRSHGMKGIERFFENNPSLKSVFLSEIGRVANYNVQIEPTQRRTKLVLDLVNVGASLWAVWDPTLSHKATAALVAAGAKLGSTVTGLTQDWSKSHVEFSKQIFDKFGHPSFQSPASKSKPGGVEFDLSKVVWDDGNWPFVECYGLLYGLRSRLLSFPKEERK